MAIYRVGSAAMSANGVITGTGTKWQTALSLVRVGSTIMFLRDELHLATISAIVSETEMRATDTDGVAVPDGDYAILLSDSLTVDGLAQDVAETLKYYQSQETEVADVVTKIQQYVKQASDSAAASEASNQASASSAAEAARQVVLAKDQVAAAKAQADAAKASASGAATSASQAANSAQTASTKASDAASSQQAAASSAGAASTSATNAKTSETNAKTSADNAAATLASAVVKSQNLNDLANKATAWTNLLTARTAASARADLGLGNSATRDVGTASGTVAAGNDSRLDTVNGKTGGLITGSVTCDQPFNSTVPGNYGFVAATTAVDATGQTARGMLIRGSSTTYDVQIHYRLVDGQYHCVRFIQNGTETFRANSNGACYAASFNPTSDSRLKFNKRFIGDALSRSMTLRGMTYQIQGEVRAGVIAQDAQKVLPESVSVGGEEIVLENGEIINDQLSLDYAGITALNTEALKDVVKLMLLCLTDPDSARAKLTDLVGAINTSTDDANDTDMRMEWALVNQPQEPTDQAIMNKESEGSE